MMTSVWINLAVEDELSEAVLRRILLDSSRNFHVNTCYGKKGKDYLKKYISAFYNASKGFPYIVFVDLDRWDCPPLLKLDWFKKPLHSNLLFRIAVHEVEAWLLADREGFSKYFKISQSLMPHKVEEIVDPKEKLIELVRKSKIRLLREAIVPPHESTRKQGPDYNGALIGFVKDHWNIKRAIHNSVSLKGTVSAVMQFRPFQ